jgi:hypothetical protein
LRTCADRPQGQREPAGGEQQPHEQIALLSVLVLPLSGGHGDTR